MVVLFLVRADPAFFKEHFHDHFLSKAACIQINTKSKLVWLMYIASTIIRITGNIHRKYLNEFNVILYIKTLKRIYSGFIITYS